ncbi:phosphate ABC transporter substrate-binding protein PstS family protein [Halomicroarcula sp. S1AR25-4]|uniref:Phosphate ABC transporter substrate-binding protein n=2 Tax=Haloarculaceae TaxID=1963268 RepID=A0A830GMI1_9EURY|nr:MULTISPECIES: phosphate ABC transporter substrate-binding protein PstS family protein [Halomicroarcula]MBX0348143.1 phosphate ABC transporter substrate-binding protein PstS family protein [Halomicroarcula pellucida]MDS0277987.1 phosphate ABC transporter substrate-binding protein PstS family protein [Halomicroarcula sp. S1AR25-4]GGN97167.1 phosphate ABC transporter substrate-binding protein [Halomicroarcula pellucida]
MTDSPNGGVSRRSFLASTGAVGALALAGCTEGPSNGGSGDGSGSSGDSGSSQLSGEINITGSSTVYPIAFAVAKKFQSAHSGVDISVSPTGSGGGFSNHFCVGNAAFNNASRPITKEEEQLCSDNGVEYHEINIATDALTVIVNSENDWVDCMTPDQLKQIWRADGASTWAEVNSDWPDEPISRFGAAETSGTFDYFNETILGEETSHTTKYEATEKDNLILQGVQKDQYGIGYFGFAYYQGNKDAVKALGIDNGDGCVKPSLETAKSGKYKPLSRSLFTYPKKSALAEEHVAEFARYYVEQSANSSLIADEIGFVPKTEEDMQAELDALNAVIDEVQ